MRMKLWNLCFIIKFHFIHKCFSFWLALLKSHWFMAFLSYLAKREKKRDSTTWRSSYWSEDRTYFHGWTNNLSCWSSRLKANFGASLPWAPSVIISDYGLVWMDFKLWEHKIIREIRKENLKTLTKWDIENLPPTVVFINSFSSSWLHVCTNAF